MVKYVSKFNLVSLIATSHGFFTLCELKMLISKLFNRVRGQEHKIKLVDSGWMSIIPLTSLYICLKPFSCLI